MPYVEARQYKLWRVHLHNMSGGTDVKQYGIAMTLATGLGRARPSARNSPCPKHHWKSWSKQQQNANGSTQCSIFIYFMDNSVSLFSVL